MSSNDLSAFYPDIGLIAKLQIFDRSLIATKQCKVTEKFTPMYRLENGSEGIIFFLRLPSKQA